MHVCIASFIPLSIDRNRIIFYIIAYLSLSYEIEDRNNNRSKTSILEFCLGEFPNSYRYFYHIYKYNYNMISK